MADQEYVHYLFIIDRSGSMSSIAADATGGIRAFIDKQLEGVDGDKRTVSFYQFDDTHELVYDFAKLEKARDYTLVPRRWTALLDAVGKGISETGEKLAALDEDKRPGYVMVIIVTDGQENASQEYTKAQVKKMIEHQQAKYNWKFTYLGANQDAFAEASSIGIARPSVLSWLGVSRSVRDSYAAAACSVSAGTVATNAVITYSDEQREQVMKP